MQAIKQLAFLETLMEQEDNFAPQVSPLFQEAVRITSPEPGPKKLTYLDGSAIIMSFENNNSCRFGTGRGGCSTLQFSVYDNQFSEDLPRFKFCLKCSPSGIVTLSYECSDGKVITTEKRGRPISEEAITEAFVIFWKKYDATPQNPA